LTYGALVSIEVTYTTQGFHAHFHIFLSSQVVRFPIEKVRKAWKEITGASWCHISVVQTSWPKAVSEVVKYPLKVADFYDKPGPFAEYLSAIEGVRLVRGYGVFCRVAEKFKPHGKLDEIPCPRCGEIGYIEKLSNNEPAYKFERRVWGWEYLPNAPPP